jgi:hypothetical protein
MPPAVRPGYDFWLSRLAAWLQDVLSYLSGNLETHELSTWNSLWIHINRLVPLHEGRDARGLFTRQLQGPPTGIEHEACDAALDRSGQRLPRTLPKIDLFGRLHRQGGLLIATQAVQLEISEV